LLLWELEISHLLVAYVCWCTPCEFLVLLTAECNWKLIVTSLSIHKINLGTV
jgi:hypothetical protein